MSKGSNVSVAETSPRHELRASVKVRSFEANAELGITSGGILAVGALVSAILLSVVPIVQTATRKRPLD